MTLREKIEITLDVRTYGEAKLVRVTHRGRKVWAAVVPADGLRRYTVGHEIPVWDWWPTLAWAAEDLGIGRQR
jgi:hypothetical protein